MEPVPSCCRTKVSHARIWAFRERPSGAYRAPPGRSSLSTRLVGTVDRPQVVLDDVGRDVASQSAARLLVEAEVDPAEDAGIIDIVGDRLEGRVMQDDAGVRES